MDGISWTHARHRLAIHRRRDLPAVLSLGKTKTRDPANGWQRVQIRHIDEAHRVILLVREQIWKLRYLLAFDFYNVSGMTDDEVLGRVAILMVRGECVLFEQLATPTGKQSLDSGAAARSTGAVTATTPAPRQLPARKSEVSAPPIEAEDTFDHDAQAATLRLAAANGTPFCEICEERKRERKKPGRSLVQA